EGRPGARRGERLRHAAGGRRERQGPTGPVDTELTIHALRQLVVRGRNRHREALPSFRSSEHPPPGEPFALVGSSTAGRDPALGAEMETEVEIEAHALRQRESGTADNGLSGPREDVKAV